MVDKNFEINSQSNIARLILNNTLGGYLLADSNGNIIDVNPAYCQLSGYSRIELLKLNITDLEAQILPEEFERGIQRMFKQGNGRYITKHRRKNGHILDLDIIICILHIDDKPMISALIRKITERKRGEEHLKKYESIVSSTLDGIAMLDEEYRYIIVNDSYERFSGVNRDQFIGKTVSEYLGDGVFKRLVKPKIDRCMQGENINYQEWFDYPILGRRFVDITYYPFRDTHNRIAGVVSNTRDITEYKQAEEALKISENKYRQLVENAQEGIWQIDEKAVTTYVNPSMAGILGYTEAEMQGRHLFSFMDEQGKKIAKNHLKRRRKGIAEQHDFEFIKKDGTRIYTTIATTPITDEQGKFKGAIAGIIDITKRVEAEESLRESEEKYRKLFSTVPDAIILFNAKTFEFIYVNESALRLYGYSRDEFKNLKPLELSAEFKRSQNSYKQIRLGKLAIIPESLHKKKDGTVFPVDISISNIIVNKQQVICCVIRDITERQHYIDEIAKRNNILQKLTERILEVQESERRIISQELHDELGQSLTAVKINLDVINKQLPPGIATELSERIAETSAITDILIDQAHDLAHEIYPSILDDLGLIPALRWYTNKVAKRLNIKINFNSIGLGKKLPSAIETAFYRICQEALTNIAKHANAKKVAIQLKQLKTLVRLTINDDGKGFDLQHVATTNTKHFGSGLPGMKQRVNSVNGKITILAKPGVGTKIKIDIPQGSINE